MPAVAVTRFKDTRIDADKLCAKFGVLPDMLMPQGQTKNKQAETAAEWVRRMNERKTR